jgi:thiol-disulfide isomerase/thioredoxin
MTVKFLDFSELIKALDDKDPEFTDLFTEKFGVAYVVAVTREKCSGCEKQKPLFERLSEKMKNKHGSRVEFVRVHAHYSKESKESREETTRCLDIFQTVAFPTYLICVRDYQGKSRETYRALEPPMSEIERNIKTAVELAVWFESNRE